MNLRNTYNQILKVDGINKTRADSFKVVAAVDKYRQFWKPKKVKVVLSAESHVYTSDTDFRVKLKKNIIQEYGLTNYPSNFVRFVYCLGYGENDILYEPKSLGKKNTGTWQYWKIFFSCANYISSNSDFKDKEKKPILKKETEFHNRIKNKIDLLNSLKKRGIWLVDASIIGINELKKKERQKIIRLCWRNYTKPLLNGLNSNYKIICIGKTVNITLQEEKDPDYEKHLSSVISQPQNHISTIQRKREFQTYFDLCKKHAR